MLHLILQVGRIKAKEKLAQFIVDKIVTSISNLGIQDFEKIFYVKFIKKILILQLSQKFALKSSKSPHSKNRALHEAENC